MELRNASIVLVSPLFFIGTCILIIYSWQVLKASKCISIEEHPELNEVGRNRAQWFSFTRIVEYPIAFMLVTTIVFISAHFAIPQPVPLVPFGSGVLILTTLFVYMKVAKTYFDSNSSFDPKGSARGSIWHIVPWAIISMPVLVFGPWYLWIEMILIIGIISFFCDLCNASACNPLTQMNIDKFDEMKTYMRFYLKVTIMLTIYAFSTIALLAFTSALSLR
ncbi:MAG: hypothetical protein ACYC5A_03465 [Thermoleophilia bacterium]